MHDQLETALPAARTRLMQTPSGRSNPDGSSSVDRQLLCRHRVFSNLDDGVLTALSNAASLHEVRARTCIFRQGRPSDALYVLLAGQVELSIRRDAKSSVLEVLDPVMPFVLATVLTGRPHMMSAQALKASTLVRIPAAAARAAFADGEGRTRWAIDGLAHDYCGLLRQIADLKLRSATQRLACYLLGVAEDCGEATWLRLPVDKKVLASRLGATPEHVSRAFRALRPFGVRLDGATVTLSDVDRLAVFANRDELD